MTWECGNEVWLNKYVDPYTTNTKTTRQVINQLPYIIGDVYKSWMTVQLKDVAMDGESILVNVTITEWVYNELDPCPFVYAQDIIVQRGGYEQFFISNGSHYLPDCPKYPGDDLDTSWRVYCDATLYNTGNPGLSKASVRLCDGAGSDTPDPGGDPGEGGSGDGSSYLIVQYFDTTSFGYSGGCLLCCEQNNPLSGGGKCTVPTTVRMSLYPWGGSYSTSLSSDIIIYDDFIIESERVDDSYKWIPFFWNDLAPGAYVWSLQTLNGPHDGTFSIIHDDNAGDQKYPAWLNGYDHYNFKCDIFGLDTDMTYERVITNGDSFGITYGIYNGNPKIKTKVVSEYNNTPCSTVPYNSVTTKPCYLSTGGNNLSFEEPTLTGWSIYAPSPIVVERSEDIFTGFPTDGAASAKIYIPFYSNYVSLTQHFIFTNCTSLHDLHFDYYVPSTSPSPGSPYGLLLQVWVHGILRHQVCIDTQGVYSVTITDVPPDFYLGFKISGTMFTVEPRTIYIDNIRFTGGDDYSMAPVGRMVGGSVVKTSV